MSESHMVGESEDTNVPGTTVNEKPIGYDTSANSTVTSHPSKRSFTSTFGKL
jgi:hypothetical protein